MALKYLQMMSKVSTYLTISMFIMTHDLQLHVLKFGLIIIINWNIIVSIRISLQVMPQGWKKNGNAEEQWFSELDGGFKVGARLSKPYCSL